MLIGINNIRIKIKKKYIILNLIFVILVFKRFINMFYFVYFKDDEMIFYERCIF